MSLREERRNSNFHLLPTPFDDYELLSHSSRLTLRDYSKEEEDYTSFSFFSLVWRYFKMQLLCTVCTQVFFNTIQQSTRIFHRNDEIFIRRCKHLECKNAKICAFQPCTLRVEADERLQAISHFICFHESKPELFVVNILLK